MPFPLLSPAETLLGKKPVMALAAIVLATACKTKAPTAITVAISTEATSTELPAVRVAVSRNGSTRLDRTYHVPDDASLPGTITVAPAEDSSGPVTVVLQGIDARGVRVERKARLGFVDASTKLLRMRLSYACFDVACPDDATCVDGTCEAIDTPAEDLPDASAVDDTFSPAGCFDEPRCLASASQVDISLADCGFPAPAAAGTFNVGAQWKGAGHAVLLPSASWSVSGGRVVLGTAACVAAKKGSIVALATSTACPTAAKGAVVCEALRSNGASAGAGGSVGAAGHAGASGMGGGAGSAGNGGNAGTGGYGGTAGTGGYGAFGGAGGNAGGVGGSGTTFGPSCGGGLICPEGLSCCDQQLVPGGSFTMGEVGGNAQADESPVHTGIVAPFLLDTYEITVGRARSFVAAYPGAKPKAGVGAHPGIPGSGWDSAWDQYLPADEPALRASLLCDPAQTWTDLPGANENKPLNCMSWHLLFAFCAWDGGRLPTELGSSTRRGAGRSSANIRGVRRFPTRRAPTTG